VLSPFFLILFFIANKATTTSLLPSPNFSLFLFEAKKMMATSLLPSHFYFFSYCYYEQSNGSNLVVVTLFLFFFLLEAKMGDGNKLVIITFFVSVAIKKPTTIVIAFFKCFTAKKVMAC